MLRISTLRIGVARAHRSNPWQRSAGGRVSILAARANRNGSRGRSFPGRGHNNERKFAMDTKELPAHPSLEQYKKQAKDLLKSAKSGSHDALQLVLQRIKK